MRARGAVAVIVLLAVALGFGLAALPPREVASPAPSPLASATPGTTTITTSFRAGFRPLLERAAAEAEALAVMGEARERNLLRIRAGQNAMTAALTAADDWLAAHRPAPEDAAALDAYAQGAATVREAMSEAQAGFLHFDFDRVGSATKQMRQGAADLARALVLLPD